MNIVHCAGLTMMAVIWMSGKPAGGYLARIGPAPLRFAAPAKSPDEALPLPPLAMHDPDPVPAEYFGPSAPTNAPVIIEAPQPEPQPKPAAPVVQFEQMISPQMFIPFFRREGTNTDVSVIAPFQFNPPANIPPPPSKATYTK